MKEEWKEFLRWLPDDKPQSTEAIVMVSNAGRVKRLKYTRWNSNNVSYSTIKENEYRLSSNRGKQRFESEDRAIKYGKYLSVTINAKTYSIHRMVAKCFIENPEKLPQVDHINGIRNDNTVENLRWCTNKQNYHFIPAERIKERYEKSKKINNNQVKKALEMRLDGASCKDIADIYCVTLETIRMRTLSIATDTQKQLLKKR